MCRFCVQEPHACGGRTSKGIDDEAFADAATEQKTAGRRNTSRRPADVWPEGGEPYYVRMRAKGRVSLASIALRVMVRGAEASAVTYL